MKKLHVKTDDTGRVAAASFDYALGEGETVLTAPEGFAMESAHDWRMEGGVLVHDPLPTPEPPPDPMDELKGDSELLLEMAADHEYRICLMEMGVSMNDL